MITLPKRKGAPLISTYEFSCSECLAVNSILGKVLVTQVGSTILLVVSVKVPPDEIVIGLSPLTILFVELNVIVSPPLGLPKLIFVARRYNAAPALEKFIVLAEPNTFKVVAVVLKTSKEELPVVTLVVNCGDVPKTRTPDPVSSDITPANSAEVVDAKSLNLFAEPIKTPEPSAAPI